MKTWILAAVGVGLVVGVAPSGVRAQDLTVALNPSSDTFTRADVPGGTLGAAGAIHVSGADATNADGVAQGVADGWLQFDTTAALIDFDAEFGGGLWEIASATLRLDEVGAPKNAVFNRGIGRVKVFWVARDNWSEGVGRPNGQGTGVGDFLTFTLSQEIRDEVLDESLAVFRSNGADGPIEVSLDVTDSLAADISAGGPVSILLTAIDASLGFTFHSRTWNLPDDRVSLSVTARLIVDEVPVNVDEPVVDVPVDDTPVDLPTMDETPVDGTPADMGPDTMQVDEGATPGATPRPSMCGAGASSAAMIMLAFFAVLRFHRASPVLRRRR